MKSMDRLKEYVDEPLDDIIIKIRDGTIKCGKYSHLVKVNSKKMIKGKELFNGNDNK